MKNTIIIIGTIAVSAAAGFAAGYKLASKRAETILMEEIQKLKDHYNIPKTAEERLKETEHMSAEEFHEYLQENFVRRDESKEEEVDEMPDDEDDYLDDLDDNGLPVISLEEAIERYGMFDPIIHEGEFEPMTPEERADAEPEVIYGNEAGQLNKTGEEYECRCVEYFTDGYLKEDPYSTEYMDALEHLGHDAMDILESYPGETIFVRNHRLRVDYEVENTGWDTEEEHRQRPWLNKKED